MSSLVIRGRVVELAMNCYGCHVLQKALDCEEDVRLLIVTELLRGDPAASLVNKHASHVWSKVRAIVIVVVVGMRLYPSYRLWSLPGRHQRRRSSHVSTALFTDSGLSLLVTKRARSSFRFVPRLCSTFSCLIPRAARIRESRGHRQG
jgi:hypothetical protein